MTETNQDRVNQPAAYDDLSPEIQAALDAWITERFEPASRKWLRRSSYGLKHDFKRDTGIYIYNGAFKGAMLKAGYAVVDPEELNWFFKIRERIPDGFYSWCLKRYRYQQTPAGDFTREMRGDYRFPRKSTEKAELESYLYSRHACPEAMAAFQKVWRSYAKAHGLPFEKVRRAGRKDEGWLHFHDYCCQSQASRPWLKNE